MINEKGLVATIGYLITFFDGGRSDDEVMMGLVVPVMLGRSIAKPASAGAGLQPEFAATLDMAILTLLIVGDQAVFAAAYGGRHHSIEI